MDAAQRRTRKKNPIPAGERDATDVDTTAHLLGVSRRTVYELIAQCRLGSIKIGRKRLIPRSERERLIREHLIADRDAKRGTGATSRPLADTDEAA